MAALFFQRSRALGGLTEAAGKDVEAVHLGFDGEQVAKARVTPRDENRSLLRRNENGEEGSSKSPQKE